MGGSLQKMWQEMGEVEEAGKEREIKEKEGSAKKIKLKDRLRTRILRGDPRYTYSEFLDYNHMCNTTLTLYNSKACVISDRSPKMFPGHRLLWRKVEEIMTHL